MEDYYRRMEGVRRFDAPVHVAYRGSQCPAQQFGLGEDRTLQKWKPSSGCIISSFGHPHQKVTADFVLRHKVGRFAFVLFHLPRCRSSPSIHLILAKQPNSDEWRTVA